MDHTFTARNANFFRSLPTFPQGTCKATYQRRSEAHEDSPASVKIDDLHYRPRRKDGLDVYQPPEVVAASAGDVHLRRGRPRRRRLFAEGLTGQTSGAGQEGTRWTRMELPPFGIRIRCGRRDCRGC